MKKIFTSIIILILLSFNVVSNAIVTNSSEYSNAKVYVFYDEENEVYQKEKNYLDENVNIRKEYINTNENGELFTKLKDALKIKNEKLPISVVGSTYFVGFDEKIQTNIEEAVKSYEEIEEYGDIVEKIKNNEDVKDIIKQNEGVYKQPSKPNVFLKVLFAIIALILAIFILRIILRKKKRRRRSYHSRH